MENIGELCWCGCQEKRPLKSHFIPGHDRRAEAAVIKAEYGSIVEFLKQHGYGPSGKNPRQMLTPEQVRKVQTAVWEADLALGQQDYQLASEKIWDATALAIKFVAGKRGWPHETFNDIYAAGRKIADEQDDCAAATSELSFAECYRANARWKMFDDYEVVEDWELAPGFIERILGHPVRQLV